MGDVFPPTVNVINTHTHATAEPHKLVTWSKHKGLKTCKKWLGLVNVFLWEIVSSDGQFENGILVYLWY